jgi:hypothetical protein
MDMDKKLKESVATLFCHAIKLDNKDLKLEKPIFCRFMGQNFDCDSKESQEILEKVMNQECDDNIDTHISIISNALYNEPYEKMNILKQLNHIIFRSNLKSEDYDFFNKVKYSFFEKK